MSTAVMTEGYRALRTGAAWIDLSDRGKIRASGDDRARLLHAMSTNHIQQMKPGDGCYAFFLNAQGRILMDANIFCFEDYFLLDTEPETRHKMYEHLDRYIIADDVTLVDQTDDLATIAIEGPEAVNVLTKLGAPLPEGPYSTVPWGKRIIARVDSTGSGGFFIFTPDDVTVELESAGAVGASAEDANTVRIENGHARYGSEVTERYLVQETGLLEAVHFSKGCYLGQEIVERVRSRAQIHRVLRRVEIDTTEIPTAGTKLKLAEADAGEIVSAALSPGSGKVVAMAYVRTIHAEPGVELVLNGAPARVV